MLFEVLEKGLTTYESSYKNMLEFNSKRLECTKNQVWFTEHHRVFTQGRAGKDEHILFKSDIPIHKSDRGGQVTYHAPGQLIIYTLFCLKSINMGIKNFVHSLEQTIIDLLNLYDVKAHRVTGAPGVYVNNAKIAAIGLRVSKGFTMHGVSFNIDMDLEPFNYINPCGYSDLKITMLKNHVDVFDLQTIKNSIVSNLNNN